MKNFNMSNNKKMILIAILAVLSIGVALYSNSVSNAKQKGKGSDNKKVEINNKTQSNEGSIKESENLPNEGGEVKQIIFIKNLTFLSKDQSYDVLMKLKTSLNTELKTLNKDIYEVNLVENTYKKTDKGFTIEATADKLNGKIIIKYSEYEFTYQIES